MLVGDLVAARTAAGMTQEEVAVRMWTTKSVVSRLESGVCTRPTLSLGGQSRKSLSGQNRSLAIRGRLFRACAGV